MRHGRNEDQMQHPSGHNYGSRKSGGSFKGNAFPPPNMQSQGAPFPPPQSSNFQQSGGSTRSAMAFLPPQLRSSNNGNWELLIINISCYILLFS